jgi:hypothetical protein
MAEQHNPDGFETIAQTENYIAWLSTEEDGEQVIHIELGQVTLHFYRDEWMELVALVDAAEDAISQ